MCKACKGGDYARIFYSVCRSVIAVFGHHGALQMLSGVWAMLDATGQQDSIVFSVFAIAVLALGIAALGRQGGWLLLLLALAMLFAFERKEGSAGL